MLAELAPWATPSAVGLLAVVFGLVVTGRLIPVSVLRRELEAERRHSDKLDRALAVADTRADRQAELLGELLILVRAQDSVQRAVLQQPPRQDVA